MADPMMTWDEMAEYFDAKQGDEGDLWHRALINPTVLRVLGDVAGKRVLDLACGNGALSRRLARGGARVTGVDGAEGMLIRAREREAREPLGIVYHLADAACLTPISGAAFDIVVCNMALMDIADAKGAVREASRVLRPGGRLVASIVHPCFEQGDHSAWVVETTGPATQVSRKVGRYREPFESTFFWRVGPGELWHTRWYHRPLSWYVRALSAAGLAVTALEEPAPTEEFLQNDTDGPWIQQVPLHLVFGAVKLVGVQAAR